MLKTIIFTVLLVWALALGVIMVKDFGYPHLLLKLILSLRSKPS